MVERPTHSMSGVPCSSISRLCAHNLSCVVFIHVTACTNDGETDKFPITSVQLLWVNLIMDTFAALALATEPPHPSLLTRSPSGKTEPLLTKIMWKYMLGHSVFQIAFLLFLTLTQAGADIFDISERESLPHRTAIFNTFVFLQVCNGRRQGVDGQQGYWYGKPCEGRWGERGEFCNPMFALNQRVLSNRPCFLSTQLLCNR